MKKIFLITISTVLLSIFCACGSRNAKVDIYYNPIGYDYNTVIEYCNTNHITYLRTVTEFGDNCLAVFDTSSHTQPYFIFNNGNICYSSMRLMGNLTTDSVQNWLNKNYKKISNNPLKWKDKKNNFIYEMDSRDDGMVILYCNAKNTD